LGLPSSAAPLKGGGNHRLGCAINLYPYQKGIAQAIGDPKVERVTVLKSARVGYSTIMIASIAHFIVREPSPILVLMPTEADCRDLMVSDIEPLFAELWAQAAHKVLYAL
jgi:phage terminase large subunit GpA-like protein